MPAMKVSPAQKLTSKQKVVAKGYEKLFVSLKAQIASLETDAKSVKSKLIDLFKAGYQFTILTPVECERATIPWKSIAHELAEKYMSKAQYEKWLVEIDRQYPPQPIEMSFRLPTEPKKED